MGAVIGPVGRPSFSDGYGNPFRAVRGLNAERVDMGVDYQASPGNPIYALGPAIVRNIGNQWSGAVGAPYPGTWLTYELTKGPDRGRIVYLAEDVTPASGLHVGQHIDASTIIGRFTGAGQTETGWAAPPGTTGQTLAAARGHEATGGDPGEFPTPEGQDMAALLKSLGVPVDSGTSGSGGGGGATAAGGGCLVAIIATGAGLAGMVAELLHATGVL